MRKMKVVSQTIPGVRHPLNRMASNWGNQSLIAYGCQNSIVIVEPRTAQVVQTLAHHKAIVTQVCWCPDNVHHSISSPYCLKLCSVDCNGTCIVWDVSMATILCEFSVGSKSVAGLKWLQDNDACRDLVALLISPNSLSIWNVERGTKVAKCAFYETITHMEFDPFNPSFLVLLSPECLIFVNDFSPTHATHSSGKKFYMSSHAVNSPAANVKPTRPNNSRRLLSADSLKNEENIPLVDCLQVAFVGSYRHHLMVLYPKEILILDLNIMQAVGSILLERNTSPFLQLFACRQRNIIYCLHENGCISVRSCQHKNLPDTVSPSPLEAMDQLEVNYTVRALSEPLRISRNCTIHELLVCPITEFRVVVLMSDGKLLLWELEAVESDLNDGGLITPLPVKPQQLLSLNEQEGEEAITDKLPLCLSDLVAPHWYSPPQEYVHKPVSLRLLLVGVTGGITAAPTCIRMCPPLTTKNWPYYIPMLAVGTTNGSVLMYKLNSSCLHKELCIHNHRIHGMEWLSLQALVTFVHSTLNASGLCRNEAAVTDTQTGHVTYFRKSKDEESPISFIRVSPQKNYLVLVFADKPLELWDAKALCLLKELPSQNPIFPAVEWSQSHLKTIAKKCADTSTVNYDVALEGTDSNKATSTSPREIVTFVDSDGSCYYVSVEGNKIKNMTPNPNYLSISNVCYMAWKGDLMVVGDSDGNVLYQDTKNGQSRTIPSAKGSVRKIRFAPGKGNTKILILYNNRLDVRDALEEEVCGQIKWGRGEGTVEDADWASSDKPVVLTSDGCIHVLDCSLQLSINVEMNLRELEEPIFCPQASSPRAGLQMKCSLQHQPWSLSYNIEPDELDDVDPVQKSVKQMLSVLPLDVKDRFYQAPGIAERCLLTAMLFGDQMEIDFWTVAVYYLSREQTRMKDPTYKPSHSLTKVNPSEDIICPDASASVAIGAIKQQSSVEEILDMDYDQVTKDTKDDGDAFNSEVDKEMLRRQPPLDLCYDIAIDSVCYRSLQLDRMLLHDSKRHLYEHDQKCSSSLLLLGQTDKAVQMLLETDPSNPNYITDLLKACLAATIRSSGASQSTIKVVATNLIANSHLMDGIQLLSLIDKGLDACRYLQTYGQWEQAAWLAKSSLCERDCADVFIRWADHLASPTVNQRVKALLVLLSIGHFQRVVETLHNMRYITLAALFSEACLQYGILQTNQSQTTVLLETVFSDYARYLHSIGFSRAMRHYCTMAGPTGSKLLDQYITS